MINSRESVVFMCTNGKGIEQEIMITADDLKYLWVALINLMKIFHDKNCETMKKEAEQRYQNIKNQTH